MDFDARYVASLWRKWRIASASVPGDWANAFELLRQVYGEGFFPDPPEPEGGRPDDAGSAYLRRFGHLHARLDPLGLATPDPMPPRAAADPASHLHAGSIAVETGHVDDPAMVAWIAEAFEEVAGAAAAPDAGILRQLLDTDVFDRFLAAKYPTRKRFGSEGADAILPMLHALRDAARAEGVDELVMGSMHRGRLSVLRNFAGMSAERLFAMVAGEHPFPGRHDLPADVPYHFGHAGEADGVKVTLLPNPSHLEAVNPVVAGYARARRTEGSGRAMAVVLHTDASVVGQGVNAELLQMSRLPGFDVGGAVHIVINNQIGFTTGPAEARSSRYCTGPWRAIDSLLLHVNGDDVDACVRAVGLAVRFRARFGRDAVVDLVCYRRNGHNEIDEPRLTQPLYYRAADAKTDIARLYEGRAIAAGRATAEEVAAYRDAARQALDRAFAAKAVGDGPAAVPRRDPLAIRQWDDRALRGIAAAAGDVPAGEGVEKVVKLLARRSDELDSGISWALAEAMALGCVLRSGVSVRLCGQDVERGPFSQRHLAAVHPASEARRYPLAALAGPGARFEVVNSPLSEYAVLGFEYGYSLGTAGTLCIWEAQFGDFLNGAQIMVDQIITSGFEKWMQTSSLTVLLPHGLEGQGPEHSSARIERLLQLCARGNIVVAHPSTPANYFHLLHRQAMAGDRPLFVISPKRLLRLPEARSPLDDFTGDAGFRPVVADRRHARGARAILCSGKIGYELAQRLDDNGRTAAILRLEQLYPFPEAAIATALRDTGAGEMLWLQEEPANYGAGAWLAPRLTAIADGLGVRLLAMVARPESASPAGSFHGRHDRDQAALLDAALNIMQGQ